MTKKSKVWRTVFGVLFILSGIGAIGKHSFWVILACLVIGAALIPWKAFRKSKAVEPKEAEGGNSGTPEELKSESPEATGTAAKAPEEVAREVALAGQACRYSYERVGLYRPEDVEPMPPLGSSLLLEREEDNPYDQKAVRAVKWTSEGVKVYGYMNKGKLRDMVSDFLDRGDPVMTKVTRADDKLELWIGMG